jgi:ABC-type multidrug transport system permease subunit
MSDAHGSPAATPRAPGGVPSRESGPLASGFRPSTGSSPLLQLTLSRFREFGREPEAVFWTFIFPLLLATGLGIAFRSRPADVVKVGVLSTAPAAERMRAALAGDSAVRVSLLDDSAAASALRIGSVALVVVPVDSARVEYRYDVARTEARTARLVVDRVLQARSGRRDPIATHESLVSERGSRYIDFVLPGLLAMNLMGSGMWGIGFGIVDARRKKLLKRFIATPMRRSEYLLSFLLMRLALMVVEVSVITTFGLLAFGVPMRGSFVLFGLSCLLGALAFGSLGLLVASRARTIEAASGLMNLFMLPMWVASGVFFSAANFPSLVQPFIQALPLTAVVDSVRGIMIQAAGWRTVGPELAIVAAWLVGSFAIALRFFRWR